MEISAPKQSQSFVKPSTVAGMVESIIGCKWSLSVLQMVHQGSIDQVQWNEQSMV